MFPTQSCTLTGVNGDPITLVGTHSYNVTTSMIGEGLKLPTASKFIYANADITFAGKLINTLDTSADTVFILKAGTTLYIELKSITSVTGTAASLVILY